MNIKTLRFATALAAPLWIAGCAMDFDGAFLQPWTPHDGGVGGKAGDGGTDASLDHADGSDGGPACTPGAKQCIGNTPQTCAAAGKWQDGAPCAYVCIKGTCTGNCKPGTVQCSGQVPQTCDEYGAWQSTTPCPAVCSAGVCVDACTQGSTQCSGNTLQTCANKVWVNTQTCPYVCSAGACTGVCTPAAKECSDMTPRSCDAAGQWQEGSPCDYVCNGGDCTGVCQSGETRCNGQTAEACDASGQWVPGSACTLPQVCCNNACVDTNTNLGNCGGCGNTCNLANATASCSGGSCAIGNCLGGYADCNSAPSDGCETNPQTDLLHCGACNRPCSRIQVASLSCSSGLCDSTCVLGYGNCTSPPAPMSDDGCELSVTDNNNNCGGCGNNCKSQGSSFGCGKNSPLNLCGCSGNLNCGLSGASGTCNSSGICECDSITCRRGEACYAQGPLNVCSCNGGAKCAAGETCCQTPNGCKNLLTDPASCGACGHACPPNFACVSGSCNCAQNTDCTAGSSGICASGLCVCSGTTCTVGKRCLASGTCG